MGGWNTNWIISIFNIKNTIMSDCNCTVKTIEDILKKIDTFAKDCEEYDEDFEVFKPMLNDLIESIVKDHLPKQHLNYLLNNFFNKIESK